MEVLAKDRKMQKLMDSPAMLQKAFGKKIANKINLRLEELEAMDNLEIAQRLPHLYFHALSGNRKGQWAIKLDENNRMLIIETQREGRPLAGPLNLRDITSVTIIELCIDYH